MSLFALYKKIKSDTSQITYQNRLLQALRNLDDAALSILEMDKLCQNIVDAIHKELGYFFGAIALVDPVAKGIRRIAISHNDLVVQEISKLPISYKDQVVPLSEKNNLLVQSINSKKQLYTTNLYDLQIGVFPKEISDRLQKNLSMKGFFVYPLIARDRIFGVIYYCTLRYREEFTKFEFDIMDAYTREVSRVLENALLYQDVKKSTEDLKIANVKLTQLDKLKDDFVSIASHELRTPMTAIRSYVWMALNRPDVVLTEKMKKYLSRTLLSTERLINLVNDMLNVSRIEAGRIEISPQSFDIVNLAKEVMEEVKPKADEKHLNLFVMESRIPQVFGDPDKLHEVLLNLVGNALKFTPANGSISISFFADGNTVETSVKDSGVGISKEDLARLFRKFERLDSSYVAVSSSGGTGLGLYISRSLIDLMHGKIWASSEGLGKGTSFNFSLPIATEQLVNESEKYHLRPKEGESKGLEPVAI